MSSAVGERWWYSLLRKIKRGIFSDSKASALLSAWFRRVGYPRLVLLLILGPQWPGRQQFWRRLQAQSEWVREHPCEIYRLRLGDSHADGVGLVPLYCCVINGAQVLGASNFVLTQDLLLHHDLYVFETDFTSEENYLRMVFAMDFRRALWTQPINPVQTLEVAAVFTDSCAANYAHWITEVLPRVAVFCADDRFKDIPLVIDAGLHVNIMASLRLLAGSERVIHELEAGGAIRVERLYWMSVAGYVPYERRRTLVGGHAQGEFSSMALGLTRQVCLRTVASGPYAQRKTAARKIFLKRNSGVRSLRNAAVIEMHLRTHGFEVVNCEELNFAEQVKVFSESSCIVGPTGAAFANLIFAPICARILVLMGEHPDTSYDYWDNVAKAVGLRVDCLLGPSCNDGKGIHSDFSIDVNALDRALRLH